MVRIDRIQSLIKEKGLTQVFVCEKLGANRGKIVDWARGKSAPKAWEVSVLSELFGVSEDYLYGRSDSKVSFSDDAILQAGGAKLPELKAIPVLGCIRAGSPILAYENNEGYAYADVRDPSEYFYLRVHGDSMINANITDGSLVLVKKQSFAEDGQIVVCIVDGENATLKRFKRNGNMVALIPENNNYDPILLNIKDFENNTARILGVAVEVKIKL